MTGRLGGVIDTYGGQVVAELRKNEEFYAKADESLQAAWDEREKSLEARPDDRATEGATSSPRPSRSASPSTPDDDDLVTLVVVSDLHCNVGMAPLIRTLVERSGAEVVLDAGDTTINGTSVEQYCVTTFARAMPDGVALVTSPGNHDSQDTSRDYARAGATVLDGSVVEVAGLRILVTATRTRRVRAGGRRTLGTDSVDAGERLADARARTTASTCCCPHARGRRPRVRAGCVPAQISGHLHRRTDPRQVGHGIRYLSSSTAGATLGEATVGPLNGAAEMTVLRWDPATRLWSTTRSCR